MASPFGTETVRKAQKILGPGSPWVVAAKRLLAGVIDPVVTGSINFDNIE